MRSCPIAQGAQLGALWWPGGVGLEGRGRSRREGIYVYKRVIHFTVQEKLAEHCKAIIFQFFKKKIMHKSKASWNFKKKEISLLGSSNIWKPLYVQPNVLIHGNVLTGNMKFQNPSCPTPAPPHLFTGQDNTVWNCHPLPSTVHHTHTHTHTHTSLQLFNFKKMCFIECYYDPGIFFIVSHLIHLTISLESYYYLHFLDEKPKSRIHS